MGNKFHFLRFVVVLLKVLAVLILLGGLAVAILGFSGLLPSGGQWGGTLRLAARIGGLVAMLVAFYYFVVFWGLSDLIRVQLSIEENTRQTHLEVSRLEQVFSAERIGRAVADAMASKVAAERSWPPPPIAGALRETAVGAAVPAAAAVQAPARETLATVTAVAAEPAVEKATVIAAAAKEAPARATEAVVQAIKAEPVIEKVTVAAPAVPKPEPRRAETVVEEAVSELEAALPEAAEEAIPESAAMLEEAAIVTPAPAEPVIEPEKPAAEELLEPVRSELGPLPDAARVMTWTGDEGAGKEAEPADAAGGQVDLPQQAGAVAGAVMTWAGDGPARQEMAEAAILTEAEPVLEEPPLPEVAVDMEEARAKAKEALDRSLGEAARQMAELEGPVVPAVQAAAEDNLAEITGIGPVFRVRLRQAGITTYAALAAMTPAQLAAVTEQTVERITRDDWIGQAQRRLAVG